MQLIKKIETRKNKNRKWRRWALFLCLYCDKEVERPYHSGLRDKSCGCSRYQISSTSKTKHGELKRGKDGKREPSRPFNTWEGMKARCYNKNHKSYKDYGGRGVKVCDEWKNDYLVFKTWALSNSYKEGLTIDRENNDGNYEPSNCRWVTIEEQAYNRRSTKLTWAKVHLIRQVIHNKLCSIKELANVYNVSIGQIWNIVNNKCWKESEVI